jgi:hypothetical protein
MGVVAGHFWCVYLTGTTANTTGGSAPHTYPSMRPPIFADQTRFKPPSVSARFSIPQSALLSLPLGLRAQAPHQADGRLAGKIQPRL